MHGTEGLEVVQFQRYLEIVRKLMKKISAICKNCKKIDEKVL